MSCSPTEFPDHGIVWTLTWAMSQLRLSKSCRPQLRSPGLGGSAAQVSAAVDVASGCPSAGPESSGSAERGPYQVRSSAC